MFGGVGIFCRSCSDRRMPTAPSGFILHSLLTDDMEHLFMHSLHLSKCDVLACSLIGSFVFLIVDTEYSSCPGPRPLSDVALQTSLPVVRLPSF